MHTPPTRSKSSNTSTLTLWLRAEALELNERLIKSDQFEFQENLKLSFKLLVEKLATILNMSITDKGTIEWSSPSSSMIPTLLSSDSPHMRKIATGGGSGLNSSVSGSQSYSSDN